MTSTQSESLRQLVRSILPASLEVDSQEVPTDVLERAFVPSWQVVTETAPVERSVRRDPVVPGVSIGHAGTGAGTLGCIVYDRGEGTPFALTNWHVAQGAEGAIGDDVLQPGPHDDNRAGRNRLGTLVRSHLGAAGDAAVCTIDRRVEEQVLGLDVVPDEVGDPELGDKVIKSGRTTAVTHGVVTRVDVMTRIDYGAAGEQTVGGFEIGPDANNPAPQGEISEGGDSGSTWIFRSANGRTSSVLAGCTSPGSPRGASTRWPAGRRRSSPGWA